jgi:hypothetical protein
MSERDVAERLRAKVAQYYGPAVALVLFPPAIGVEGEVGDAEFMSEAVTQLLSGGGDDPTPGEAERLVMAALLVLLHEGGGGNKVTFMLPELLELLGWPLSEPSEEAVERALDFYMRLVRREYTVPPASVGPGREVRVTSSRRLIWRPRVLRGERVRCLRVVRLAGRHVTVTFNPDVPLGARAAELKSGAEGF